MDTPPHEIQALIFDLFGVLVSFDDRLVYDRISQHCECPSTAFQQMYNMVSEPELITGQTSLHQLHARLVDDLQLTASFAEFERIWQKSYSEPMPGVKDVLHQLTGKCRLVLLSNVDQYYWPTIESSLPELDSFDAKVLSFQEGVAKPSAVAFKRAVAASGVPVQNCYFVDDKSENIEAAAEIGLTGHVFTSCRELKATLRQAGLQVA
jgi:HAD superfamily hydrolase (TIGR01509 family)